jgi:hypothetical protein
MYICANTPQKRFCQEKSKVYVVSAHCSHTDCLLKLWVWVIRDSCAIAWALNVTHFLLIDWEDFGLNFPKPSPCIVFCDDSRSLGYCEREGFNFVFSSEKLAGLWLLTMLLFQFSFVSAKMFCPILTSLSRKIVATIAHSAVRCWKGTSAAPFFQQTAQTLLKNGQLFMSKTKNWEQSSQSAIICSVVVEIWVSTHRCWT